MKRYRPFEISLRIVGALLDCMIIDAPRAAGQTARDIWDALPWSRRARRLRQHRHKKRLDAIYARNAALYGNHTPAFRAAVTEELIQRGLSVPEKWQS